MEVNLFGFTLVLDRALCPFCMSTDAIAIVLDIMTIYMPVFLPLAAVADGAAFVGIYDEIRYQAEVRNFWTPQKLNLLESMEFVLLAITAIILLLVDYVAMISFLVMAVILFVINIPRYKSLKGNKGETEQLKYYLYFELIFFLILFVLVSIL